PAFPLSAIRIPITQSGRKDLLSCSGTSGSCNLRFPIFRAFALGKKRAAGVSYIFATWIQYPNYHHSRLRPACQGWQSCEPVTSLCHFLLRGSCAILNGTAGGLPEFDWDDNERGNMRKIICWLLVFTGM